MFFVAILVAQVSALLRYILLARILGPEELGLAATLTVTSAFFDMISETGSDRFLIQDRDGDTPPVQGLVQIVYLCRGFLTATALVVSAYPIALFYHSPRLAAGLALLALPSIINGFLHLDVRRVQRDHDFQAQAVVTLVAEVGALVATGVAAWLTHQFTAVIFGLVTRALLATTLSHLQAKRPYRLKWDRAAARRLAHFAAPLTINGFLLFIVSQSDRVIVGNQLGLTALGKYSAMMLLIYYPTTMVSSYLHGIYIPIIAAHRDDLAERGRASDGLGGLTVLLGLAMVVGYAALAPTIAPAIFGHRFAQPALLVGMVGALQIARFLLSWPTTAALAIGRSRTVLLGNLTHIFGHSSGFHRTLDAWRPHGGCRGLFRRRSHRDRRLAGLAEPKHGTTAVQGFRPIGGVPDRMRCRVRLEPRHQRALAPRRGRHAGGQRRRAGLVRQAGSRGDRVGVVGIRTPPLHRASGAACDAPKMKTSRGARSGPQGSSGHS